MHACMHTYIHTYSEDQRQLFVRRQRERNEELIQDLKHATERNLLAFLDDIFTEAEATRMLEAARTLQEDYKDRMDLIAEEIEKEIQKYLPQERKNQWDLLSENQKSQKCKDFRELCKSQLRLWNQEEEKVKEDDPGNYEKLYFNRDYQMVILKSDTRCSDRIADLTGGISAHLLKRLLNRLPLVDVLEEKNQWSRSLLLDLATERTYLLPVLLQGVGLMRWHGVTSGIGGHSETTSAATVHGLNVHRIKRGEAVLKRRGTREEYKEALFGERTETLEQQVKELNKRLPQSLEGPSLPASGGGLFRLPDSSVTSPFGKDAIVKFPFVGGQRCSTSDSAKPFAASNT